MFESYLTARDLTRCLDEGSLTNSMERVGLGQRKRGETFIGIRCVDGRFHKHNNNATQRLAQQNIKD
jgi:hypothetical protein